MQLLGAPGYPGAGGPAQAALRAAGTAPRGGGIGRWWNLDRDDVLDAAIVRTEPEGGGVVVAGVRRDDQSPVPDTHGSAEKWGAVTLLG